MLPLPNADIEFLNYNNFGLSLLQDFKKKNF
jgi:hypothetical protein